jgi:hypothetical protein
MDQTKPTIKRADAIPPHTFLFLLMLCFYISNHIEQGRPVISYIYCNSQIDGTSGQLYNSVYDQP